MTKREIAEAAQGCLMEIMSDAQMAIYPDITNDNADDAIGVAESAVDDIDIHLSELEAVLREAGE